MSAPQGHHVGFKFLGPQQTTTPLPVNADVPASCMACSSPRSSAPGDAALVPVSWGTNATVVAIALGEEHTVTPHRAVPCLNLQELVHDDPPTTTGTLLEVCLLRHETVQNLQADANVRDTNFAGEFNLLPELLVLGVVVTFVELLDPTGGHVLLSFVCGRNTPTPSPTRRR